MPTCEELAQTVADELGRPELVTDWNGGDYTPTEMFLRLINRAHRELDRQHKHDAPFELRQVALAQGAYTVPVPAGLRYVTRIDLTDSSGNIVTPDGLDRRELGWLRQQYGKEFANIDQGTPLYWARNVGEILGSSFIVLLNNIFVKCDSGLSGPDAALSPDGTLFAYHGGSPSKMRVIEISSGNELMTASDLSYYSFSSDGRYVCGVNDTVSVFDLQSEDTETALWSDTPGAGCLACEFTQDGRFLVVSMDDSGDYYALVYNALTGDLVAKEPASGYQICCSPDGRFVAVSLEGSTTVTTIMSLPNLEVVEEVNGVFLHDGLRTFSPNSARIALLDEYGMKNTISVYETSGFAKTSTITMPHTPVHCAWLNDAHLLVQTVNPVNYAISLSLVDSTTGQILDVTAPFTSLTPTHFAKNADRFAVIPELWVVNESIQVFSVSESAEYDEDELVILPPTDTAYTANIFGASYTEEMDANSDVTWWSYRYPEALVAEIKRQVAVHLNRNTTEAKDYQAERDQILLDIEQDIAFQDQYCCSEKERRFGSRP